MSRTTRDPKLIKSILKDLTSIDQLKRLFHNLGYEIVNGEEKKQLPSRKWPANVQLHLAENPLLIATGGDDPTHCFKVIHVHLNSESLSADYERVVINQLQKACLYGLFVFSNNAQTHWHFINVIADAQHPNKQILRRLAVGPEEQRFERLRTAIEVIANLDLDRISHTQGGITPLHIQTAHDLAFDVRSIRDGFYEEYERVFSFVEHSIKGIKEGQRRYFTQRLFNRLMFLAFIERKGWLRFAEKTDYLATLFEPYRSNDTARSDFYGERIRHLFFKGLCTPNTQKTAALQKIIGEVSFLNSELFQEDDDDDNPKVNIPNEAFAQIFDKLFYAFNFTVTESTPLDVWVAVDPEMLGRVFEELVTRPERRGKGGYYTPKEVVTFMCREAIKGYLNGHAELVDEHDASKISVPEARKLLKKLEDVKVVDPACGSGAYLLGMLHELHTLTRLLDTRADRETARDDYQRKLSIIQNNLYGVDKDPFAVNIARLRLWLSLAVEHKGEEPEPLPNLDFKIEVGDSLTAPNPQAIPDMFRNELVKHADDLTVLKDKYMRTHDRNKKRFSDEIQKEKKRLAELLGVPYNPEKAFDWRVEFAEVFKHGGFDIVLANPPYNAEADDNLRDVYFNRKVEGAQSKDTYGLFIARGLQLLRTEGHLCYIVSDTWRTIKSHKPLRKRLLTTTSVKHVLDLPTWVFKATVNTCILTLKKGVPDERHTLIAGDLRGLPNGDWEGLAKNLVAVANHGIDVQTTTYARYTYPQSLIFSQNNLPLFAGLPRLYSKIGNQDLKKLGTIAKVSQGISTGQNKFYVRRIIAGEGYDAVEKSKIMTKKDIAMLSEHDKFYGIEPSKYSGRCFIPFDKGGSSNADDGLMPNYWSPTDYFIDWAVSALKRMRTLTIADRKKMEGKKETIKQGEDRKLASALRNPTEWFKPAITYSPTGFYSPTFRISAGTVFQNTGSGIICEELPIERLLGILSSTWAKYVFKNFLNHTVHTQEGDIAEFPLCDVKDLKRNEIDSLVKSIIEKQQTDPCYPYHLHEQKEIDTLIYQLYGLNSDDIREVELWFCRRYSKLAEAQGVLADVENKYADYLARCKRVMEKSPVDWKSHPILVLIAQGEGALLEFKETLEVDIKTGAKSSDVLHSALKTIAGFLNTKGGTLLLGVSDSGEIKGLERDLKLCKKHNTDGFEQKLRDLIKTHLEPAPFSKIAINCEELPEGTICRMDVPRSDEVTHLDEKEIYIRDGNRTLRLEGPALTKWIEERTNRKNVRSKSRSRPPEKAAIKKEKRAKAA